jgi:hypothetical protein
MHKSRGTRRVNRFFSLMRKTLRVINENVHRKRIREARKRRRRLSKKAKVASLQTKLQEERSSPCPSPRPSPTPTPTSTPPDHAQLLSLLSKPTDQDNNPHLNQEESDEDKEEGVLELEADGYDNSMVEEKKVEKRVPAVKLSTKKEVAESGICHSPQPPISGASSTASIVLRSDPPPAPSSSPSAAATAASRPPLSSCGIIAPIAVYSAAPCPPVQLASPSSVESSPALVGASCSEAGTVSEGKSLLFSLKFGIDESFL